jgi:hypothetical protein
MAWRGGRVVECTALEMRHTGNRIGGSNPSLSATLRREHTESGGISNPRFIRSSVFLRQSEERKERARSASALGSNPLALMGVDRI